MSFAVNDRPGVSLQTRVRILEAARELGWRPSASARALTEARTRAIGLVLARDAAQLVADYPGLNVLINNAGIMQMDAADSPLDDALLCAHVETNFIGPLRLTSALVEHLKTKEGAVIAYTSSVLAFVPLAPTAVYSATKAALHSYILSQRFMLKETGVRVLEIAPPWVRTDLMNSREAGPAMPLEPFIEETMAVLGTDTDEVLVEGAKAFRANPGVDEHAFVDGFNAQMLPMLLGVAQ